MFLCSGNRVRKQLLNHGEWDASSFGSNASQESAGTAAHRRNEQEEIAAQEVEAMHWEDQVSRTAHSLFRPLHTVLIAYIITWSRLLGHALQSVTGGVSC